MTQRQLNRAVLARQLLLERGSSSLPKTLERIGGIQAQYAPSMYIGLWTRLHDFERDSLTRALERRAVVQATLMRVTIHLVSKNDYWPFALAIRDARRKWFLRSRKELSERDMVAAAEKLDSALAERGTLRRTEIADLIGKPRTEGVGLWLDTVRVPPSGTWERRRADLYARAVDWIGPAEAGDLEKGQELLVTRYLKGFGPATIDDIANFSGLVKRDVEPVLERLNLRRFDDGLLDVPRAPLPDPETPAPVRFLPTWDQTLIGHCRERTGILTDEHRAKVFANAYPQSFPTFLVDGSVAGTWKVDAKGKLQLEPFVKLDAATRRSLRDEGERLAAFHAAA